MIPRSLVRESLQRCVRAGTSVYACRFGVAAVRRSSTIEGNQSHKTRGKAWEEILVNRRIGPLPPAADFVPLDNSPRVHGGVLEVWDGVEGGGYVPVSGRWLRDNCTCAQCRNRDTKQRQINVLQGTLNCDVIEARALENRNDVFQIIFGDGHHTLVSKNSLANRESHQKYYMRQGTVTVTKWTADIASQPPEVQYSALKKIGLGSLLHKIREYGFCFVDDMPATPEATQALLEAIGPIRNTHYGGFYDFTSDLSSKDTAYTSEALEPHTDNTYFTEPAGLQALHLLSHTNGTGGESSLVDGFAIASQLFKDDREAYMSLSEILVHAHASGNEGISIQPSEPFPVLSHHPRLHHLTQVRWNNADRAGIDIGHRDVDQWYDAATKFDTLVRAPENQFWFQLKPGRLLIFDNWRVMHGRSAFTGKRRICGGYINRDDFISRFRMTNLSQEEIDASTVTG